MPNLVFLTRPSLQILGITKALGISDIQLSGQPLVKGNCHNSRTSDDIDIKLGPVNKIEKRNKKASKKLTMASCLKIATSLSFFSFTASLEQSGSRTKKSLTQL